MRLNETSTTPPLISVAPGSIGKLSAAEQKHITELFDQGTDAYTMDLDVLHKCCIGELIPDGRMIPFCAYNSLGYRQKVWSELASGAMK